MYFLVRSHDIGSEIAEIGGGADIIICVITDIHNSILIINNTIPTFLFTTGAVVYVRCSAAIIAAGDINVYIFVSWKQIENREYKICVSYRIIYVFLYVEWTSESLDLIENESLQRQITWSNAMFQFCNIHTTFSHLKMSRDYVCIWQFKDLRINFRQNKKKLEDKIS